MDGPTQSAAPSEPQPVQSQTSPFPNMQNMQNMQNLQSNFLAPFSFFPPPLFNNLSLLSSPTNPLVNPQFAFNQFQWQHQQYPLPPIAPNFQNQSFKIAKAATSASYERPVRHNPAGWRSLADSLDGFADGCIGKLADVGYHSNTANIKVVFEQSVFVALLDQIYSDMRYEVLGYLGGRFIEIPSDSPSTTIFEKTLEKPLNNLVCLVSHFASSERIIGELINDDLKEVDNAFRLAKDKFHGFGVSFVGWYKSNNALKPLLPTRRDLCKTALMQRLHPNSVGVIFSVASSNHPNRLFPSLPTPITPEIAGPFHSLVVYQAYIEERADRKSRAEVYPTVSG
ncbi:hypothetical protein HK096_011470, partial [Nowakowskiella sp. JEL0078]